MAYVHKVISPQEKILVIARPHWIYLAEGLLFLIGMVIAGFVADYYLYQLMAGNRIMTFDQGLFQYIPSPFIIPGLFGIIGLGIFWPLLLVYASAEVGLTDQRIIYKKGLFFIEIDQVDLEDIRAEQVHHGWLGWMLKYGKVHLDCRFVGDVWLPAIAKPYRLLKTIHIARMRHPDIDYDHRDLAVQLARIARLENKEFKDTVDQPLRMAPYSSRSEI